MISFILLVFEKRPASAPSTMDSHSMVGLSRKLTRRWQVIRMYCLGFRKFFLFHNDPGIAWNIFDFLLVAMGVLSLLLHFFAGSTESWPGMPLSSGSFADCRSCVCCERQTDQICKRSTAATPNEPNESPMANHGNQRITQQQRCIQSLWMVSLQRQLHLPGETMLFDLPGFKTEVGGDHPETSRSQPWALSALLGTVPQLQSEGRQG